MRLTLLTLAFLYAWLPTGMCACQLQATLLPNTSQADDQAPSDPVDDDDEGPGECHCPGAKPICIVAEQPCLAANDPAPLDAAVAEVTIFPLETSAYRDSLLTPFPHALQSPLKLTLRALLI
jgi:hypothetical protein